MRSAPPKHRAASVTAFGRKRAEFESLERQIAQLATLVVNHHKLITAPHANKPIGLRCTEGSGDQTEPYSFWMTVTYCFVSSKSPRSRTARAPW